MTDIVRRLREACTGGRECQCSYRVAADEIERLRGIIAAHSAPPEKAQAEIARLLKIAAASGRIGL